MPGRPKLQDCTRTVGTGECPQLSGYWYPHKQAAQPVLTAKGAMVQGPLAADNVMWKNVRLGRTPDSQMEREASVAS